MGNIDRACAFTGHRAEKLPWKDEYSILALDFKMQLCIEINLKIKAGCEVFYTGMCNGVDIIAGEMVLELKAVYPHIKLISVIPYEEFPTNWSEDWRDRYFDLLAKSNDVILLNTKFKPEYFKQRNQYLVNHAQYLIAVRNEDDVFSGTMQTINMAKRKKRSIVAIEPSSLKVAK